MEKQEQEQRASIKVKVHDHSIEHFWEPSCEGAEEFWAFNFAPRLTTGDNIYFVNNGKVIARAEVLRITGPGTSACAKTCKFKNKWKMYWKQESFVDLRDQNVIDDLG